MARTAMPQLLGKEMATGGLAQGDGVTLGGADFRKFPYEDDL